MLELKGVSLGGDTKRLPYAASVSIARILVRPLAERRKAHDAVRERATKKRPCEARRTQRCVGGSAVDYGGTPRRYRVRPVNSPRFTRGGKQREEDMKKSPRDVSPIFLCSFSRRNVKRRRDTCRAQLRGVGKCRAVSFAARESAESLWRKSFSLAREIANNAGE